MPGLIPAHAGKTQIIEVTHWEPPAHPRSRGENFDNVGKDVPFTGSSPLTRGKHDVRDRRLPGRGLIPAHAGKTCVVRHILLLAWAHPRSRGENPIFALILKCGCGSSPLTRGKRGDAPACPAFLGLIPAHAGKTRSRACLGKSGWAHPRSRGENGVSMVRPEGRGGSSPLTRGKQDNAGTNEVFFGLIPAHAGKTDEAGPGVVHAGAHPRSRGENS